MDGDEKRPKKALIIILGGLVLGALLMTFVGPGWLKSQVHTGPQNTESREITYLENIIFKPLLDGYNKVVDLFRPSNFRNFDWAGFGCLFLPNNPQQIPTEWLSEKTAYCY